MPEQAKEAWTSGRAYEQYVGRWSRHVASKFLAWLAIPAGETWGDVGCGTGALAGTVLKQSAPTTVLAIDRSKAYLAEAKHALANRRVGFVAANAAALPWASASCHATISGLVLNFVPNAAAMVREMVRVTQPQGRVALYVWDYAGEMQMMRHFWDAAHEVSPEDDALDEAERFPLCQPEPLKSLFQDAGLNSVATQAIEIPTVFRNFNDYWLPFLGKQGAAPTYLASVSDDTRDRIREALQARLTPAADGSIALVARAWAVQGTV